MDVANAIDINIEGINQKMNLTESNVVRIPNISEKINQNVQKTCMVQLTANNFSTRTVLPAQEQKFSKKKKEDLLFSSEISPVLKTLDFKINWHRQSMNFNEHAVCKQKDDAENDKDDGIFLLNEPFSCGYLTRQNDNIRENLKVNVCEVIKQDNGKNFQTMWNEYPNYFSTVNRTEKLEVPQSMQIYLRDKHSKFLEKGLQQRKEQSEILKKIRKSLSATCPSTNYSVASDLVNLITSNKEKIINFCSNNFKIQEDSVKQSTTFNDMLNGNWPEVLMLSYFGIFYNLSEISEKIEFLNLSVIERFIKSETSSSFQVSANKTKVSNINITQSPGSRLSHLAKRRAMFSSANLQFTSLRTKNSVSRKQILLTLNRDQTKFKSHTPKKKNTLSKTLNSSRTPNSVRKNIFYEGDGCQGLSKETSKRALFQSPPKRTVFSHQTAKFKLEAATRVEKSKRALFSPEKSNFAEEIKNSRSNCNKNLKRKLEIELNDKEPTIKRNLFSTNEPLENDVKKFLKAKSTGFCYDVNKTSHYSIESSFPVTKKHLPRSSSDTLCSMNLSDSHRKKLLWAVSQALQKRKIGTNHPDFKKHVSALAKVIKRLFLEFHRKSNSASETLLKLSKKYVCSVLGGKTSDEIYLLEKHNVQREKLNLFNYEASKISQNKPVFGAKEFPLISPERHGKPFSFNSSYPNMVSKFAEVYSNTNNYSNDHTIQSNNHLQKNDNLKENSQFILKKSHSGHKNFTGKDEQNISPYFEKFCNINIKKIASESFNAMDQNLLRAKRKISFDEQNLDD